MSAVRGTEPALVETNTVFRAAHKHALTGRVGPVGGVVQLICSLVDVRLCYSTPVALPPAGGSALLTCSLATRNVSCAPRALVAPCAKRKLANRVRYHSGGHNGAD